MGLSDYISFGLVLLAAVLFVSFSLAADAKDKKKAVLKYTPEKKISERSLNVSTWNRKPRLRLKSDRHLQLTKTVRRNQRDSYLDQKEKEASKYIVSPWF